MLCRSGVFSTATRWSPILPWCPNGAAALLASASSAWRNAGSVHARAHDTGTDMRADLGFIGLDDRVQRRRVGIALLNQDGLKGANPQFGFRELRGLVMVVLMVIMRGHGRSPVHWRTSSAYDSPSAPACDSLGTRRDSMRELVQENGWEAPRRLMRTMAERTMERTGSSCGANPSEPH